MSVEAIQPTPERDPRETAHTMAESGSPFGEGRRVGRYRLRRSVSPRGNVWLAHDPAGRSCALKSGPAPAIGHEYSVLAGLTHANLVRVLDYLDVPGSPVLVLEYLPGGDLVSLAGLAAVHWLGAAAEIAGTLGYLHAAGFVHRDVKARNVLFDDGGHARLIDFGSAARIGSPWTTAGTTSTAVDPARGAGACSAADDGYALAALLYELMHGAPPGRGPAWPAGSGEPAELAALVRAWLDPVHSGPRPALERFGAVIESLLQTARS